MRSLQEVLENDFGVDLTGWTLQTAFAITPSGHAIVGAGLDPSGQTEGWVVAAQPGFTPIPECGDGLDNGGDGATDFPTDPGCFNATHFIEEPACSDGLDNDGDTITDFPNDPGCMGPWDRVEIGPCGLGYELVFLLPPLMCLHGRRRKHRFVPPLLQGESKQ